MNIGFTFNVRHVEPDINNPQYIKEAEFDTPETIEGIVLAIESLGHKVYKIEANEDAFKKFQSLRKKLDLVFNFAEGMGGADREAQIPAFLEMLGMPYTGPKPLSYALGLHKAKAKEIMSFHGVPTPRWITVISPDDLDKHKIDFFPVIAKPLREGSSKGIRAKNLVQNNLQLRNLVHELISQHHQEVLVEEYLEGREFTVGIIGNPPRALPIIEIMFDYLPKGIPKFDHYEAKWIYDGPGLNVDPLKCPASISSALTSKIEKICLSAFEALEMVDWARFDIRLDKNGDPQVIEVNCPPGIMPDPKDNSRFPRAARAAGIEFPDMVELVLKSACDRYGIQYRAERVSKKKSDNIFIKSHAAAYNPA